MAYSSKTDAVAKLIDSKTDQNALALYSNNTLFDSTTIFYSNSAKTILASAGNYVLPTNYNSLYFTLGSDGKIVGTIAKLDATLSDTTWIDDRIYNNGVLVSNQGSIGGTNLSINNLAITDSVWFSRPYLNDKAWTINNGTLTFTPMVDINVSDMKGYDLLIYSGEYVDFKFVDFNYIQAFCHVKADVVRQTIFGNKIYFFKPDYWIPNSSFTGGVTYFRRMPNISPINDRYGKRKLWIDMASPYHDFAENVGVPRVSTKMNKGLTHTDRASAYGYSYAPDSRTKLISFMIDEWIINPISFLVFGYLNNQGMKDIWNDYYQNMAVAMIESLVVSDSVWATGSSPTTGFPYQTANPHHWKTTFGSGDNYSFSPFATLTSVFYEANANNADQIQWDAEYYYKYANSTLFGQAFRELCINVGQLILYDIGELAKGAVKPNFSGYAAGIYDKDIVFPNVTPSNVATSVWYQDYHEFYVNGTLAMNNLSALYRFFTTALDSYSMSYSTNYQTEPTWQHAIYGFIHNYDISKKCFTQIFSTANHDMRVMAYTWNLCENAPNGGLNEIRNTFIQQPMRADQNPALNQSLAVWGMAYADGLYCWADGTNFDEFNTSDASGQLGRASWDWAYVGYWQVFQNKDIVEANTAWLVPDYEKSAGSWTISTENYPVVLFANKRPICRYKLSADGTKALVICTNPFNNGYTKATHKFRLPAKSNYEFTVDTWGTYTTVIRLINL